MHYFARFKCHMDSDRNHYKANFISIAKRTMFLRQKTVGQCSVLCNMSVGEQLIPRNCRSYLLRDASTSASRLNVSVSHNAVIERYFQNNADLFDRI